MKTLETEGYYYIRNSREDYEYLLKVFSCYSTEQTDKNTDFTYLSKHNDAQLSKLYNDYSLLRYQKDSDEIATFLKVLRWSHEILLYGKQADYHGAENASSIIEHCKQKKTTVNCRQHAIVLTEALLSMGYKARLVCCLPIDVLPCDSHTITAVYSHKIDKWIALDSARNCCFLGKDDTLLSVSDIRRNLIENKKVHFEYMHRFSFSNSNSNLIQYDDDWYLDYLYKNFFRFYCSKVNGSTDNIPQYFYHLIPTGYSKRGSERTYCYNGFSNKTIKNTDNSEMFWSRP